MNKKVLGFLMELKASDETIAKIYLEGSCFRLYKVLRTVFPKAVALYSISDGHWITKINGKYYDINGRVSKKYVKEKNYQVTNKVTESSAYIHTYSNNLGTPYNKYE